MINTDLKEFFIKSTKILTSLKKKYISNNM